MCTCGFRHVLVTFEKILISVYAAETQPYIATGDAINVPIARMLCQFRLSETVTLTLQRMAPSVAALVTSVVRGTPPGESLISHRTAASMPCKADRLRPYTASAARRMLCRTSGHSAVCVDFCRSLDTLSSASTRRTP